MNQIIFSICRGCVNPRILEVLRLQAHFSNSPVPFYYAESNLWMLEQESGNFLIFFVDVSPWIFEIPGLQAYFSQKT